MSYRKFKSGVQSGKIVLRKPKSKRKPRRRLMSFSMPIGGMPRTKLARLRYATQFAINPNSLQFDHYSFKLNSLYDPDNSGSGHQPYGFDNLMAYYTRFSVVSCKVTLNSVNNSTTISFPGYYAAVFNTSADPTLTYLNIDAFLEDPKASPIRQTNFQYNSMPNEPSTVVKYWKQKSWFGPNMVANPNLQGTTGGDPSSLVYCAVVGAPIAINDPAQMNFMITLDYIALFTDPKLLTQS